MQREGKPRPEGKGADVGRLHERLLQRGFRIDRHEVERQEVGRSTMEAIRQFQAEYNRKLGPGARPLPMSGQLDDETARTLTEPERPMIRRGGGGQAGGLPATAFTVRGEVQRAGQPLAGATVRAFHQGVRKESLLGEATTDVAGAYAITYDPPGGKRPQVNLSVRLMAGEEVLLSSPVVLNAAPEEHLDLIVPDQAGEVSAFERLQERVAPHLDGVAPADLTESETAILAAASGVEQGGLDLYVLAHRLQSEHPALPAAAYYGLLVQGLPSQLPMLAGYDATQVKGALEAAVAQGAIPADLGPKAAAMADQLEALGQKLKGEALAQLLDTSPTKLKASLRQRIIAKQVRHKGTEEELWQELAADPEVTPEVLAAIRFTQKLAQVTRGNLPLVRQLQQKRPKGEQPLQALAALDQPGWQRLVAESLAQGGHLPEDVPGDTEEERVKAYAWRLSGAIEHAFPLAFLIEGLKREPTVGVKATRRHLIDLLEQAPDLDLRHTVIETYFKQREPQAWQALDEAEKQAALGHLKAVQRVWQVAPRYAQVDALLGEGLDSAVRIAGAPEAAFVAHYNERLGGEQEAAVIHRRAKHLEATTAHLVTTTYQLANDVTPLAMQSLAGQSVTKQMPSWSSLFGRVDLCECDHCRSVYSPAAYLVDLLQFLNPTAQAPGLSRPIEVLRQRRPDLEHILLTCENTNTTLPYVDLVNEVLESYVVHGQTRVNNTSAGATSDALSVNREYTPEWEATAKQAYDGLTTAIYPLNLPFDRSLETVRAYLSHLGSSRHELLEALPGTQPSQRAAEYLGLPELERQIILGNLTKPIRAYFGYTATDGTELADGLRGTYYNYDGSTTPVVTRIDPTIDFNWHTGTPVPGINPDYILVRWDGQIRVPVSDTYTFHTTTDDGVRVYLNGTPIIDKWQFQGVTKHSSQPIKLEPGKTYTIRMDYFEGRVAAVCKLAWSRTGDPVETVVPTSSLQVVLPWHEHLAQVPEFLRRTGLTLEELLALLATRFVNPDPANPVLKLQIAGDACDLQTTMLSGLLDNSSPLKRVLRFIRLWRKVGGSMADLDRAFTAIGDRSDFLERFVESRRVQQLLAERFRVELSSAEVLSLWANMGADLYRSLFQNKAVFQPLDPGLDLRPDGTEIIGYNRWLGTNRPVIMAALRLSAEELSAVMTDAGFDHNSRFTLDNISKLHRYALLARSLQLSIEDLITLRHLTGLNPFTPFESRPFIERVLQVRESGFTIPQLNYLLRDIASPASGLAPAASEWTSLATRLAQGFARIQQENPILPDPTGEEFQRQLASVLSPVAFAPAVQIIEGQSQASVDQRRSFLAEHLPFLPQAEVEAQLLPPLAEPDQLFARRRYVVSRIIQQRVARATDGLIVESLGQMLDLLPDLVELLLRKGLRSVTDPAQPAIRDYLSTDANALRLPYTRLRKAALLVRLFGISLAELTYFLEHSQDFGQLDLHLPVDGQPAAERYRALFTQWEHLRRYCAIARKLPAGPKSLLDLFQAAATNAPLDLVLWTLAAATGWGYQELSATTVALGFTVNRFVNAQGLGDLQRLVLLGRKLGVSIDLLATWASKTPDWNQATSIRDAVKARYDEAGWIRLAAPIADQLRERQKDALIAYLLTLPAIRAARITTANQLFEYFLIDVEMSPCMKTSRIKQAIASVQLFVQRCLLNLEPALPPAAIDATQWEWMKQYRVWEANRKLFLYPENWLEPELRSEKSELFREMETDLLQTDITPETVEAAFRRYAERLADIARLEIVAIHQEMNLFENRNILHVVGRSYSTPHVYYYRRLVNGVWLPWEKVDLDIQGDHVLLFLSNNRLFLLWPLFERVALPEDNLGLAQGSAPRERWQIKLAWSQYQQGKWTPKRTLPRAMQTRIIDAAAPWKDKRRIMLQLDGSYYYNFEWFDLSFSGWPANTINTTGWSSVEALGRLGVSSFPYSTEAITFDRTTYWSWRLPLRTQFMNNTYEAVAYPGHSNQLTFLRWNSYTGASSLETILENWHSPFRLVPVALGNFSMPVNTFLFQDSRRTYLVQQDLNAWGTLLRFSTHYHPMTAQFLSRLNRGGVAGLLDLATQKLGETDTGSAFRTDFLPTSYVQGPHPTEKVEFEPHESYGLYNTELFFHMPLMLADRLYKEQRFAEAQGWFHRIFNPTSDTAEPAPSRYWRFLPFHRNTEEQRIWKELLTLADPDGDPAVKERLAQQIADWQQNPFDPHRIARLRMGVYQKSVLMKYLDNLIAWADMLFAQDTIESLNEATQLYVLAANLLGPRPERIPELVSPAPASYSQLQAKWDDFANAVVDVQNQFPFIMSIPQNAANPSVLGVGSLYFGIPRNEKLLRYWDLVEDRLFKVRHCLNLEGMARTLSLFEQPLDPALLIKAKAAGIDLSTALSDVAAPLGQYRFPYLLPKAMELCSEVKSLGQALLSALEKKDAEVLANMRATQESAMLRLVRQVRERQVDEARVTLEGLQESRKVVETRFNHYKNIVHVSPREREHLERLDVAQILQGAGQVMEVASAAAAMFPEMQIGLSGISSPVLIADFGGINISQALSAAGRGFNFLASLETYKANRAATLAGWDRRSEDWNLQADLAQQELVQIDKQIVAAEIRLALAERELANHDRQIENAQAVELFMREKFTNQELYSWMIAQVSSLFFRVYQLAYDLAKRAERAFRFERGLSHSNFVQFGYWDSLNKGLLSGERLYLDLKRMEMAYLDQSAREYELTKQVSLLLHDPMALIALKETGHARIHLPEALFDMDYPGHYMRRIKAVSLTIPCVTGPYTGIHATLTLESSRIRTKNDLTGGYRDQGAEDSRFLADFSAVQSIATSHGQNDAGLFELSFRDERYLPFEGAGAISTWRLEMPKGTNAFDFDTITDLILKVQYTAREGGRAFRDAAFAAATLPEPMAQGSDGALRAVPGQQHLRRLYSLRHEFPTEWQSFLHPAPAAAQQHLLMKLTHERFPYQYRGRNIQLVRAEFFLKLKDGLKYDGGPLSFYLSAPSDLAAPTAVPLTASDSVLGGVPHGGQPVAGSTGTWRLEVHSDEVATLAEPLRVQAAVGLPCHLNPGAVEDIAMLCWYRVS